MLSPTAYRSKASPITCAEDDGAWLYSDEGNAFFQVAADYNLIASIAGRPSYQPAAQSCRTFPRNADPLPSPCGGQGRRGAPHPNLNEILASAALPNMYIKLSGFHYCSTVPWGSLYSDTHWVIRALYERFGPYRMCGGSDYPVVRKAMTYQHALEAFRTHCTFVPDADKAWILGNTLAGLLEKAR
ncbi:MAG: amidohydrolase family protein [Caldilineaceae bacterium]